MTQTAPAAPVPDDATLARRARRGDLEAFELLVTRHQRLLTAHALRRVRHVEDADDLVQEAFIRAWERLGSLSDPGSFRAWIRRILDRLAIDRARSAGPRTGSDEGLEETLADDASSPEDELLGRELAARIDEALDALPPGRQREVMRLRFCEGLPIQDIADRLGVHTGTVKVHIFRSSRRLRAELGFSEEGR